MEPSRGHGGKEGRKKGSEGFPYQLGLHGEGGSQCLTVSKNSQRHKGSARKTSVSLQSFTIRLCPAVSKEDATTLSFISDCVELSTRTASPEERRTLSHGLITSVIPANAVVPSLPWDGSASSFGTWPHHSGDEEPNMAVKLIGWCIVILSLPSNPHPHPCRADLAGST